MMTHQQKTSTWKVLTFVIVAFIALSPTLTLAQYTPLAPLPCVPGNGVTCPGGAGNTVNDIDFEKYVQYAFNLIIAIAAAAAIFMIVVGGFQYMTTDSWSGKSAGLDKARNAVYGLILVLTSFILLRTIDPRLVNIKTTLVNRLEINYDKLNNDLSGFYAQLQKDAVTYGVDLSNFTQNIQQAEAAVKASDTIITQTTDQIVAAFGAMGDTPFSRDQVNDLCSTLEVNDSDSEAARILALCQKLKQEQVSKKSSQSVVDMNKAEGSLRTIMQQCGQSSDPSCFTTRNSKSLVSDVYNDYASRLEPGHRQQFDIYTVYAKAWITIHEQLAAAPKMDETGYEWNQNIPQAITNLNLAVTQYTSLKTADPDIVSEMKKQQQILLEKVAKQDKIFNGTGK